MVRLVRFGSSGPEFKSRSVVELIPGGVNSTCHPSEVSKMRIFGNNKISDHDFADDAVIFAET